MDSGIIKLIVNHKRTQVLLVVGEIAEQWRRVDCRCPIAVGDMLSWSNGVGYLSSKDCLYQLDRIGPCRITNEPERHWTGSRWVDVVV